MAMAALPTPDPESEFPLSLSLFRLSVLRGFHESQLALYDYVVRIKARVKGFHAVSITAEF
eukprot:scaffold18027_cov77-Skeletonema_dohrnii-CCMP3373.AAC.3